MKIAFIAKGQKKVSKKKCVFVTSVTSRTMISFKR